jgi:hypothetical protein
VGITSSIKVTTGIVRYRGGRAFRVEVSWCAMAASVDRSKSGPGPLIAGAGGALLIVSLFLPWADGRGISGSGWELWTIADVFFLIVGLTALAAAITGGRVGVFRPDVSLIGAADLLAVVSTILLIWLVAFDFPADAGRGVGVFLALVATVTIAAGAGDYSPLRGAPWFPPVGDDERRVE